MDQVDSGDIDQRQDKRRNRNDDVDEETRTQKGFPHQIR